MASSEERLQILKLIQEGKITAEEGVQLLDAVSGADKAASEKNQSQGTSASTGKDPRWFRVRVTDTDTGKTRVNIRLPINVLMAGAKMGAKFSPEVEGLDMGKVMEFVRAGETGQVLDMYDDQDGEHIEVFIE